FFSSRRRHTRSKRDWSSDVCSSDLTAGVALRREMALRHSATIHADPDRLAQVLGNLLSNALRHTSPRGTVTVSSATHGSTVEIAVTDDGEGFTAEDRSRLFERFFRADSSRTD